MVTGGRPAASKRQVEQSPERDEPAAVRLQVLTSDLHGGSGTKLTNGFDLTPMAGRFTCRRPPPPLNGPNVQNASQLIVSLPRHSGGWSASHYNSVKGSVLGQCLVLTTRIRLLSVRNGMTVPVRLADKRIIGVRMGRSATVREASAASGADMLRLVEDDTAHRGLDQLRHLRRARQLPDVSLPAVRLSGLMRESPPQDFLLS